MIILQELTGSRLQDIDVYMNQILSLKFLLYLTNVDFKSNHRMHKPFQTYKVPMKNSNEPNANSLFENNKKESLVLD